MIEIIYFDGTKINRDKNDWSKDTLIAIATHNRFIQTVIMEGEIIYDKSF